MDLTPKPLDQKNILFSSSHATLPAARLMPSSRATLTPGIPTETRRPLTTVVPLRRDRKAQLVAEEQSMSAHPLRLLAQGLLVAFVTTLFAAFCIAATIGMWYLVSTFDTNAYRAVSVFLVLIVLSNVASKYLAWCIGKLSA